MGGVKTAEALSGVDFRGLCWCRAECMQNELENKGETESTHALWARSIKNTDCSTGSLARRFARSLAPLNLSLAPHYSLRSRALLRSLGISLAHSLARGKVND